MKNETIHLGYAVGSGDAVGIPLRHMAVTGQTQESGKTTTLEALISRANVRAIAFVTKRGEGSFSDAHQIQPYFRDDAGGRPYWEFVESIVASTMGQKMKFERAWIAKAAKGATSLRQVRENLHRLQGSSKRAMDQDLYMLLGEYLDIVLPQMAKLPKPAPLDLQAGLNVMDLTRFTEEMQMLIVRSALLWIHEKERGVVTIIPEAWKFIPEARLTPVKPAAERLIREGAALKNFVWMDSQDIAGVWKLMLRAATVWIIGVQREANEIKRTLANIPAGVKTPKAAEVATLGKGEFFACHGKEVRRVYVQPVWLSDDEARAVAVNGEAPRPAPKKKETMMAYDAEKASLERENLELRHKVEELQHQLEAFRDSAQQPAAEKRTYTAGESLDNESLYQAFKKRLVQEAPAILRLLTTKPEIEVKVQRQVIEADASTLQGRLAQMIAEGFFESGATGNNAYEFLKRVGFPTAKPNVYKGLDKLTTLGFVTKGDNGYTAVAGMKVNIK
jgi:hypothetical protein